MERMRTVPGFPGFSESIDRDMFLEVLPGTHTRTVHGRGYLSLRLRIRVGGRDGLHSPADRER